MRHLSSYLCLNIGWGAFWQVFSCFGLLSGGRKSDPDALDCALIELEAGQRGLEKVGAPLRPTLSSLSLPIMHLISLPFPALK